MSSAARSRRTTMTPLKFVINGENIDIANKIIASDANKIDEKKKKRKHSMRSTLKRSPSIEKIVESKKNDDSKKEADPQLKQKIEVIKRRQSLISEQQKLPSPPPPPPPPAAPLPPPPIPEYLIFPVEFDENDFKRSSIHYAIIGSDITDVKKNLRKVSEPPTNKSCPFLGDSIEECAPEC